MSEDRTLVELWEIEREKLCGDTDYHTDLTDAGDALAAEIKRLTEGAKSLCDQLDVVGNDPKFVGVFSLAQIHGMQYTGPQFDKALEAMRLILSQTPERESEAPPGHGNRGRGARGPG